MRSITVVIPTRERPDTLFSSLRTVVDQDYDNLEIIVSDNFSQDLTEEVVRSFNDPRVRYLNTGKRLSMSANWEFALNQVSGDWVTVIGDDDGLLPNALEMVNRIADETGVEAIRAERCQYKWPTENLPYSGKLSVPVRRGVSVRKSSTWRNRVLNGTASYTDLPMLYNGGFVRKKFLDVIRHKGFVYRSCIPDVYSAIAVSHVLDNYAFSYQPLAINGASRHSTGSSYFSKNGCSKESAIKFQSEENIAFHSSIPLVDNKYPKSIQALIFESCAQFKDAFPDSINLDPCDQVAVILASIGSRTTELDSWVELFCEHHGIDVTKANSFAKKRKLLLLAARLMQASSSLGSVKADGSSNELSNVFEASLVANRILEGSPFYAIQVAKRFLKKTCSVFKKRFS